MIQIDSRLRDLLVREAHLRLSLARLTPVSVQKEADLRAIEAAKPSFWSILSKNTRQDYETRLAAAKQDAELLRQGVKGLDRVEAFVKSEILVELEKMVSAERPGYGEALAALRQKDAWMGCVGRFAGCIHEFTSQLGNVRNLACSGYARKANAYSENAGRAFQLAIDAARKIDEEVELANRLAEARAQIFIANGFKLRPLPKLEPTGFAAWVARISTLPLAEAQKQFDELFGQTKKLGEVGIPDLRAHGDAADVQQLGEVRRALFVKWAQLRAQVAPEVFPGDTARIVDETEALMLEHAKQSAAASA